MAKSPDNRKPETARSRKGFQHAAATARGAVDRIAGKQGFAEANVLLNWPAIAGAELAATCQPVKVTYGPQRTLGATLIVQASSARAPEIEMKGPMIVERVNQYYGYRAISRLKVTQSTGLGPSPGFSEAQAETGDGRVRSGVDYYGSLNAQLEDRLKLMKEIGGFEDMDTDPGQVNLRELERRVKEYIASVD